MYILYIYIIYLFIKDFVYLSERERVHEQGVEGQREREKWASH